VPEPIGAVRFRGYRGEGDFPGMLAVYNGSRRADGITEVESLAEFTNLYRHLTNCTLETDVLVAESDSGIVGYGRVTWWVETADSDRVLLSIFYLLPEARGGGAAEQMLHWTEARLTEIAAEHPHTGKQFFTAYLDDAEEERGQVLAAAGYLRTQTYAEMVRPLSEPIPAVPLPDGVEIRPVTWDLGRALWEADDRAFRDHHGHSAQTETDYERWRNFEHADPSLWKVAFAGDAIAGQVLNHVNAEQNTAFGRAWGWTESISVQREWRKRGVAKALITESMRMFRAMGMTHVALGVHTANPNGAFPLYEGLGYRVTTLSYEVRKSTR
jgi:GNAT superfamily N-acetyltransferase